MSRLAVTAAYQGVVDPDAVVGWDPGLSTYFLQAFSQDGAPSLWLGTDFAEFTTPHALAKQCLALGVGLFHVWGRTIEDQRLSDELNEIFNSIFSGQPQSGYNVKALH